MTAVEDLARYPETEEQATAEALARYYAVEATRAWWEWKTTWQAWEDADAGSPEWARLKDEWNQASLSYHHSFTIAYLLRALAAVSPEQAAGAARRLYGFDQEGDAIERLYDWLTGYGIDPDTIAPEDSP